MRSFISPVHIVLIQGFPVVISPSGILCPALQECSRQRGHRPAVNLKGLRRQADIGRNQQVVQSLGFRIHALYAIDQRSPLHAHLIHVLLHHGIGAGQSGYHSQLQPYFCIRYIFNSHCQIASGPTPVQFFPMAQPPVFTASQFQTAFPYPGGNPQTQQKGVCPGGFRRMLRRLLFLSHILESKADFSVIRVLRFLCHGKGISLPGHFRPAGPVQHRIDASFIRSVGIFAKLGYQSGQIRRTAIAQDILCPLLAPDQLIGKFLCPAQHIFIEKAFSVHADACQIPIQHHPLQHIRIPGFPLQTEHAPRPIYAAHGSAGLIIGRHIGKLVLVSVCLMHKLMLEKISIGRGAVIQGPASPRHIHLLGHKAFPDLAEHLPQFFVVLLQAQIRHAGIQIVCPHGMSDDFVMLPQGNAVLIVIHALGHGIPQGNGLFQ